MVAKILVSGITGRMSKLIIKELMKHEGKEEYIFLGALTRDEKNINNNSIPKNKIFTNYYEILKKTDLIIDFSTPEHTLILLELCKKYNIAIVSGTTGFTEKEKNIIARKYSDVKSIISSNFSFLSFLQKIFASKTGKLIDNATISIEDTHHKDKKDLPSGTSFAIKKAIGKENIQQLSFGVPELISKHRVIFEKDNETLEIIHYTKSHQIYASYALKYALWLYKQKESKRFNISEIYSLTKQF